ncbi:hypothetical protein [Microcystis aeruginosa]|uniref:Uncharacterized protein n=1 Tax=Microcystis aeruginosa FD4 TaxID=2686288 RepID=A0A857D1F1_MICAE|nr:hypothetical protein [Microcystis aeruginosa]QGZ89497.1 hypothetical protein GQR42_07905 [Microcystis aeruginosa FD4]
MTKPSLLKKDIWGNHEKRVLELFSRALKLLQESTDLPDKEDDLSRQLFMLVRRLNCQNDKQGLSCSPIYQGQNQPVSDDASRSRREDKKPDFQWEMRDSHEINPERMSRYYTLEAKRLGSPSSKFQKDYVLKGIQRFILAEWGYGKSVSSGAMIGYIQNMELKEILNEVNKHCSQLTIIDLTLSPEGWQNDVSRLDHQLERPEVPPSPFNLRHLWVDLRSKKTDNNDDTSS